MDKIENILYAKLHHIDHDRDNIEEKIIDQNDAENYISKVISDLIRMPNTKKFEIQSEQTEVISIINDIMSLADEAAVSTENEDTNNIIEEKAEYIANRLKTAEKKAKDENKNLKNEITKGSLLQCFIEVQKGFLFILSKIEHEPFIDTDDMTKHYGFPFKKITLKCCTIKINEEFAIEEIKVSDTGNTIAKYWRDYFLELQELKNDINNTIDAFSAIDSVLKRSIKRKSQSDYFILKEKLKGYFSSNTSFKNTEMIDSVLGNYTPYSKDINEEYLQTIKDKLNKLPENKKFDSNFEIDISKIEKKITEPIQISDEFEINLKTPVDNLKDRMIAGIEEGVKYLKIYRINEETYNTFKSNDEL